MATVEAVNDTGATFAQPPTVRLEVTEVLNGFVARGQVAAVWGARRQTRRFHDDHPALGRSSARVPLEGPRPGSRWIVGGAWTQNRRWLETLPDLRLRATEQNRRAVLGRLERERRAAPPGEAERRGRLERERRAAVRDAELIEAVAAGKPEEVRALLARGVRAAARDEFGVSALCYAVRAGDVETVSTLARGGVSVRRTCGHLFPDTPLHEAARQGHEGMARALLALGAETENAADGVTPLLCAVEKGHAAVVRALVEGKANPNAPDRRGTTPLMLAAEKTQIESLRLLIGADASVDASRGGGVTALMLAASKGCLDCLRVLIEARADVNARSDGGRTPLMEAARAGSVDNVELLIEAGAEIQAQDRMGKTAADYAGNGNIRFHLRERD